MRTMTDMVLEHVAAKPRSTYDVARLLELPINGNYNSVANTYWAALSFIEKLQSEIAELKARRP